MSHRDDDIARLRRCLVWIDERDEIGDHPDEDRFELDPFNVAAFRSMLEGLESNRWEELTEKQRRWVHGVCEKLFDEPEYHNDFSAGRVPLGSSMKTPTPEVLKRPLPMKPPGRR
jgi:hypothetical protein